MDPKTVSYYFIEYAKRSKNFRFYYPSHITRIVETGIARFIKDGENSKSDEPRNTVFEKIRKSFSITVTPREFHMNLLNLRM